LEQTVALVIADGLDGHPTFPGEFTDLHTKSLDDIAGYRVNGFLRSLDNA
jgi:hypothetical protein